MTATHPTEGAKQPRAASLRALRRSAVALAGALLAAGALATSGAGAPTTLAAAGGARAVPARLVQPAVSVRGLLVEGVAEQKVAELVSLDQVLAVLQLAEGDASEAGRRLTPEVDQAAGELGMLLHRYLADHPEQPPLHPQPPAVQEGHGALEDLLPDSFEELPAQPPAPAQTAGAPAPSQPTSAQPPASPSAEEPAPQQPGATEDPVPQAPSQPAADLPAAEQPAADHLATEQPATVQPATEPLVQEPSPEAAGEHAPPEAQPVAPVGPLTAAAPEPAGQEPLTPFTLDGLLVPAASLGALAQQPLGSTWLPGSVATPANPDAADRSGATADAEDAVTFGDVVVAALRLAQLLDPGRSDLIASAVEVTAAPLLPGTGLPVTLLPGDTPLTAMLRSVVQHYGSTTAGYSNGRIPLDVLCPLPFASGHRLRCDAAAQLTALNAAFRAEFGRDIPMTDSYRTLASQIRLKATKGFLAATPGYSLHGWGIAVDLGAPISSGRSAEYTWLRLHGPDYGWDNPSWARHDGRKPEPWHFEFFAAGPIPNRALSPADVAAFRDAAQRAGAGQRGASSGSASAPHGDGGGAVAAPPAATSPGGDEQTPGAGTPATQPPAAPQPTPTPTESPTPKPTPSGSPSPTPTPSGTPSPAPSGTPTPSPTPTGTPKPSPTPTGTPTPTPSGTPSPTPSGTPTPTVPGPTPTPAGSPSAPEGPSPAPEGTPTGEPGSPAPEPAADASTADGATDVGEAPAPEAAEDPAPAPQPEPANEPDSPAAEEPAADPEPAAEEPAEEPQPEADADDDGAAAVKPEEATAPAPETAEPDPEA